MIETSFTSRKINAVELSDEEVERLILEKMRKYIQQWIEKTPSDQDGVDIQHEIKDMELNL
jgi:hypothetical protein